MTLPIIAGLLLLGGASLFLLLRMLRTPLTNPLTLTIVPQVLILGFTFTNLNSKLENFSSLTWIIILGSWLAFILGAIATMLACSRWKRPVPFVRAEFKDPWLLLILCFGVYLVGYTWGVFRTGSIPVLSAHPEDARLRFVGGYFHEFLNSFMIPTLSLCLASLRKESSRRYRWASLAVCSTTFILYLTTGSRFFSLFALVNLLVVLDVLVRPVKVRTLAIISLAGIIVFIGVGYLRYGRFMSGSSKLTWAKGGRLALEGVYAYAGNGYWNLDFALSKMERGTVIVPTYGGSIGEGSLVLIGVKDPIQEAYRWDGALNHAVMKFRGLNSTSFHWALIKDFGVAAPLVWSFFWGVGLMALDRYARLMQSISATLVFGHLSYYSFMGFLIFPFIIPPPVTGSLLLCLCLVLMRPKGARSENLPKLLP